MSQANEMKRIIGFKKSTVRVLATSGVVYCGLLCLLTSGSSAFAQKPSTDTGTPPKTWVDPDTGHRVIRLTDEPGTEGLYFNMNDVTPDGLDMVYRSRSGIYALNLQSFQPTVLYSGKVGDIVVSSKSRQVFFMKPADLHLYAVDIDSKHVRQIAELPFRAIISSANADDTLIAGTYIEGTAPDFVQYKIKAGEEARQQMADSAEKAKNHPEMRALVSSDVKVDALAMERRLQSKTPEDMFTVDLKSGKVSVILKGTDWLNHVQFSPTNPNLIMYAHEGPATEVDRIWTVRADGSQNQLIHKRQTEGETANHEFWDHDGKTIWYDLQKPHGLNFFLASYNTVNGEEKMYRIGKNDSSSHYAANSDDTLFCGDGRSTASANNSKEKPGQLPWSRGWIEVLHPIANNQSSGLDRQYAGWFNFNTKNQGENGWMKAERLVNLFKHNYGKLEPNARFSPDNKYVIFNSDMFGATYLFAVEVKMD